jgi:hypothetical protein
MWRQIRILPPCKSWKVMKREFNAWRYKCVTLSLGDINTETWAFRLGARLMTYCAKKFLKSKGVETGRSNTRNIQIWHHL